MQYVKVTWNREFQQNGRAKKTAAVGGERKFVRRRKVVRSLGCVEAVKKRPARRQKIASPGSVEAVIESVGRPARAIVFPPEHIRSV